MYHEPVLVHECLEGLALRPDGTYVDATFGGGGHSRVILDQLEGGRLIVFDQDADAEKQLPQDKRLVFVRQNFRHIKAFLKLHQATPVDGILADLGVSSHQLDTPKKGFSTRFDGPLDMRMDQDGDVTAASVINNYDEHDLVRIFSAFGEITNSKTLASVIVAARREKPIKTTDELKKAVSKLTKGNPNRYLAQLFQALRIEVNDEMGALQDLLQQSAEVLRPGGRMVLLAYHSLEDRLAKNFFKRGVFAGEPEKDLYGNFEVPYKLVNKKPIGAAEEEIARNPRARSAKLRIAEKL
jgi:16S rRNA (cytosine1402-N4)-methyltransferase